MSKLQIVEKLRSGKAVDYREHGNSMLPLIASGSLIHAEPINVPLEKGDVVLCKVNGNIVTHKITALRGSQYQISNNQGHVNGWVSLNSIYGIVTKVEGKVFNDISKRESKVSNITPTTS